MLHNLFDNGDVHEVREEDVDGAKGTTDETADSIELRVGLDYNKLICFKPLVIWHDNKEIRLVSFWLVMCLWLRFDLANAIDLI